MIDTVALEKAPLTYQAAIDELAAWHGSDDGTGIVIFVLDDPDKQIIRFVEVSDMFGDGADLRAVPMAASAEFPFRTELVLMSEHEWEQVKLCRLSLPDGWSLDRLRKIFPHGEK